MSAGQGSVELEGLDQAEPQASFGKYQMFASLGRGGMADVFLAVARGPMGFNKLAVVKRLRSNLAGDPSFRNMFLDEARLAARLNHPNVVHTYEVGEQDGVYFIAMEYLEGQSLNKVIREAVKREEVLDQAFCARLASDALAGLQHAHELRDYDGKPLGIIHRDVSPHNVFVTYSGQVKMVDFGIAKAALSSTETEVGVLKGKVAYMAPEQAVGGAIDQRADVFAMGIVLWELLTRQRLMTGDSAAVILNRLLNAPIPSVSTARPDVDPELDAICARALEKDPRYRFQSAQEMRDALDRFIAATGKTVRQDEIGRTVGDMFVHVREEVQQKIQEHMALVTQAASAEELAAANGNAPGKFHSGTMAAPGSLLKLGTSGSGSGVVPHFGYSGSQVAPSIPPRADYPPQKSSRTIILLLAALAALMFLVVIGLAVLGLQGRDRADRDKDKGEGAVASAGATSGGRDPSGAVPPGGAGAAGASSNGGGPAGTPSGAPDMVANGAQPGAGKPGTSGRGSGPGIARHGGGGASKPPPPTPPAAPAADDGFLTLDTYPWTRVTEGSKAIGNTPLVHVPLSAGSHTLTLENPEQGIKQPFTITIKSGETISKRLGLK